MKTTERQLTKLQGQQDLAFDKFKISTYEAATLRGGRTVGFDEGPAGDCHKVVDSNDGEITKIKWKERYQGKC